MPFRLSKLWLWLLFPVGAGAFIGGAYLYFYQGGYHAPPTVRVPFESIVVPTASVAGFVEAPTPREGVFLLDVAHSNNFDEAELSPLLSRVASRGYTIEFLGERDHGGASSPPGRVRLALLEEKLREADSFAVILPQDAYAKEEVDVIERYVEKGGRLLLIGDPSRHDHINSVAEEFGITFQDGFLYNVVEHDLNYRNIFLSDFLPNELTQGLGRITLYTAGSIQSGVSLVTTDGNTYSSTIQRTAPFAPVVKARDGGVLGIFDITFMIPPQDALTDNSRFIANIADFLTNGQRSFELVDFPHFFSGPVDILLGQSSLFPAGTAMKSLLLTFETPSELRGVEDLLQDTVFLGLYEDARDVAQYLSLARIQVGETLRTPFTPAISPDSTGMVLLHQGPGGRRVLIVLGDTESALHRLVELLGTGRFRTGLVSDSIGVYHLGP